MVFDDTPMVICGTVKVSDGIIMVISGTVIVSDAVIMVISGTVMVSDGADICKFSQRKKIWNYYSQFVIFQTILLCKSSYFLCIIYF